jgi:hypothetical protein
MRRWRRRDCRSILGRRVFIRKFLGLANVIHSPDMEGTNVMGGMSGMKSGGEGMEFVGGRVRGG